MNADEPQVGEGHERNFTSSKKRTSAYYSDGTLQKHSLLQVWMSINQSMRRIIRKEGKTETSVIVE